MFNLLNAVAEGGEHHSILLPHTEEVVWSAIILVILFTAFLKFLYPKYQQIVDERATKIQAGLDLAEKAKQQLAETDKEIAEKLHKAKEEAAQIRSEAQVIAKGTVDKARAEANKEADRIVSQATRQIEAQRQAAEISLRADVGMLATELAEKIVGEELKHRDSATAVVDRFLDELSKENLTESVN